MRIVYSPCSIASRSHVPTRWWCFLPLVSRPRHGERHAGVAGDQEGIKNGIRPRMCLFRRPSHSLGFTSKSRAGIPGPGHVCTIVGYSDYEPIAERYHVPIVITGFEPLLQEH